MAISTDSIIHYTDEYSNLVAILKEGFKIKYCAEVLLSKNNRKSSCAHPMISFCDIPLSNSDRHFELYGFYGIGLSKEWAKKQGVNPVLYIEKESIIGECLMNSFTSKTENSPKTGDVEKELIIQVKCFTKNYSGPLKRGKIDENNYKFYDEREWRLIPKRSDIGNSSRSILLSEFNKDKNKWNSNLSKYRFKFSTSDISYIIVKKTNEIPEIIEFLKTTFYKSLTGSELDILLSKVCSTEQIIKDY